MALLKKLRNNHILSLAGNAIVPCLGMFIFAILAHDLPTKEEFGYWVFFQIVFNLLDTFRTGFLQTALVKFHTGSSLERSLNVAGSAWFIGLIITAVFCLANLIVYIFFWSSANMAMVLIFRWLGITLIASLPYSLATWILQAEGRFGVILWVRLINQGLFLLFILFLMYAEQLSLLNVVYANLFSSLITSVATLISGWDKVRTIRYKSQACIIELFHFGKYSVGTSISAYLLRSSDTFIIKFLLGPASVAVYYLPQRLMEIIEIPLRSFTSTALPLMSAAVQGGNIQQVSYLLKKYAGILTVALIPVSIATFICADLIIGIIGGTKYQHAESANIFRIFMCYAVLLPVDRFLGITLDIMNKPRVNMVKVSLMLFINVTGDFISLSVFHSIYGVAVTSIFTCLTGVAYGYYQLIKYLDFSMSELIRLGLSESKLLMKLLFRKATKNIVPL